MSYVVKTEKLTKVYDLGSVQVQALRGIDLKVREGEFVAILGPSGGGKSTLLHLIGALDKPTSGNVAINDKDTSKMDKNKLAELRQNVGFVFQYFNLITRFTALKNVELAMTVQGKLSKKQRHEKAIEYLNLVELGDRINHKINELSGGQQQRVAIARALAQNPHFLLLDEPTGNVDSKTRDVILNLIKKLNVEKEITVILITHDPFIAQNAKRIVFIVDGQIRSDISSEHFDVAQIYEMEA